MALNMAPAPVEEKGYKSMINLPDWISVTYFTVNFKNSLKTREFYPVQCSFQIKRWCSIGTVGNCKYRMPQQGREPFRTRYAQYGVS